VDETWNVAAQVEQRVHLHGSLGRAKVRPRKYRQAQVDGGRVQGIDGVRQFQPQVFLGVELPRLIDQPLREVGVDAPVAGFVGVGQRAATKRPANSGMVEFGAQRSQTSDDVAQALAIGQLRERHATILIGTTEIADSMIAVVTLDDASKRLPRQMLHQLREHQLACIHGRRSGCKIPQLRPVRRSSR
jgi:hypothetical protein